MEKNEGGVSEICDPLPLPVVASGSTETVGATVVELVGSIGRVFDSLFHNLCKKIFILPC